MDFLGGAAGQELTEGDGTDAVTDVHHQAHVVLHQENGAVVGVPHPADGLSELGGLGVVEAGGGLKAFTPETITEKKALMKELESVRLEGVGRDRNEYISGDNCSAVPIMNGDGKIVAAISVSALEPNMSKDEIEGAIPKLKEMANRISSMLGYYAV